MTLKKLTLIKLCKRYSKSKKFEGVRVTIPIDVAVKLELESENSLSIRVVNNKIILEKVE